MSYLDWHGGDQVICVKLDKDCPPRPAKGETCTISFIYAVEGDVMIDLLEYASPETDDFYRGYDARYFRKVQTRKTDISIFTSMLNGAKERERA